jgi:myo-inositol-1(or 4)-monophosphatase
VSPEHAQSHSVSVPDWQAIFTLAVTLAREAGLELRQRFGHRAAMTLKGPFNPVTEADHAAETLIRCGIQQHFPTHAIVGEEQGESNAQGAVRWIVDPLDGTVNYAHTFPHFAVSIGVADGHGVQVGVIYDPIREELFTARRGQPAHCNGAVLHVSPTAELQRALLATGFPYDGHLLEDNNQREFAALSRVCQGVRRPGTASLDLAYVACGRLDGYWEQYLSPWDVAAGALLVECAGGRLSTYTGSSYDGTGPQVVASNGWLHDAMLTQLASVRGVAFP